MYPEHIHLQPTAWQDFNLYRWVPKTPPKACLVFVHGMMEHAKRYHTLAVQLNKAGIAVYGVDLPGHGQTGEAHDMLGHLPKTGWQWMCESVIESIGICREDFPDTPIFLMGHSMGSYIAQIVTQIMGDHFGGLILSGTSYESPLGNRFANGLLSTLSHWMDDTAEAHWIQKLVFGNYNTGIKDNPSDFAWLTRDPVVVNAYEKDPLCGNTCTLGFYRELTLGLYALYAKENFEQVGKYYYLPMLFQYGSKDPLSHNGKSIKTLIKHYEKLGFNDITEHCYPDARHEVYQEINKDTVYSDLITWIHQQL